MSTATLEVGGTATLSDSGDPTAANAPGLYLSASQIEKFTSCEQKWVFGKTTDSPPSAGSDATDLGTLLHTLKGAWWSGRSWRAEWILAVAEYMGVGIEEVAYTINKAGEIEELDKGWTAPKVFHRAPPIMAAWEEVHGTHPSKDPNPHGTALDGTTVDLTGATLVALELPFDLPIPGVPDARVRGFIDGLISTQVDKVRVHDQLWIIEEKSMGKWGRENQVPWDPQLNLYLWAAKQLLPNLQGAVFEAISTYAYKEGPPSRRFKRIPLAYDPRIVDQTMKNVAKVARRGKTLLKNPGLAIRSIGGACTYCDHRMACLTPWLEA